MELRFFDFEVFPDWWCCTFGELPQDCTSIAQLTDDLKDTFRVVSSDMPNARDALMNEFRDKNMVMTGYNIKSYDLEIANGIYNSFDCEDLYTLSQLIVKKGKPKNQKLAQRLQPFVTKRYNGATYLDLFDSSAGSLKGKEAILGLDIRESNVPFGKENLTDAEKNDVIQYNKHDVWSSMYWYLDTVKPFVDTRLSLCKVFNLPEEYGYKKTNASLISLVLGAKRMYFGDENKIDIELPVQIRSYCETNLPKYIYEYILHNTSPLEVKLFENVVKFADGGIHSEYDTTNFMILKSKDRPVLHIKSNAEWVLMNADAGSYYPSIMIFLKTLSRAIQNPELFIKIYNERLRIKHLEDPTPEDIMLQLVYKLILNTTFGASGCEGLDLYDPYMRTCTCRYGQLFLAAFANKVYTTLKGNVRVIQTNTDGVLFYCRRVDVPVIKKLMQEWHDLSGITLEEEFAEEIWQRDVNNYLMVKEHGKIKCKGSWLNSTKVVKGYPRLAPLSSYAVGKAIVSYLTTGKDVVESIKSNTTLEDFAMTFITGSTFDECVYRYENGFETPALRNNRGIASTDNKLGCLYKVKMDGNSRSYQHTAGCPDHILLLSHDIRNESLSKYRNHLDYDFYINIAKDKLSGSWLDMDGSGVVRTSQFDYFDVQNRNIWSKRRVKCS
uniref:DNA polymerase n=1 Tax=Siphoviridae sp. ctv4j104 TaxID=2826510 RepID=A0A8S5M9I0_9CAUD|nr:MAG TPA: DNA polymerase [Siphoviridae sp. ctv4j104]